ncbi:MAG: M56 family metallopeptidase [Cyanobacterium sp. T60_A2020_053]|nr:M56 family metallopeptidase [Cyanobacterium sp. T60_A2020_053]
MSCFAIIAMGYQGKMWGYEATMISYSLACLYLVYGLIIFGKYIADVKKSSAPFTLYSTAKIYEASYQLLPTNLPYAGLITKLKFPLISSTLVISQGLIDLLSPEHLQAVIEHEKAHQKHQDPLIFFWLSLCKRITFWLPYNEEIWSDLVLFRELRADATASEKVDFLLLAESLIMVTEAMINHQETANNDYICAFTNSRLQERIEALINQNTAAEKVNWYQLSWTIIIFIPLLIIPFHQ